MNLLYSLQQAIDACRPGHHDPDDPGLHVDARMAALAERLTADDELRQHYEASLAFDARLQQGIEDVPVPADLQHRLLNALSLAQPVAAPVAQDPPGVGRRRWLWAAASLAAAACVALVVGGLWPQRPAYDLEALYRDARDFHSGEIAEPGVLLSERRPDGFAPSGNVIGADGPHVAWRKVKRFLGRGGVAYQLQSEEGVAATLYVVKLAHRPGAPDLSRLLPSQPPKRPSFTDGVTTAAWQQAPYAHVLVIDGPERHYRQFVREPRSLAVTEPGFNAGPLGITGPIGRRTSLALALEFNVDTQASRSCSIAGRN